MGRNQPGLALNVTGGDGHFFAQLEHDRAAGEPADAYLRSGEIGENRDVTIRFTRQTPDALEGLPMAGVIAMGHVETKYVDACIHQARDGGWVVRGRPERRDDLGPPQSQQSDFGIDGHGP